MESGWIINFENGSRIIYSEAAYKNFLNNTQISKVKLEEHWFNIEQAIKENPSLLVIRTTEEKVKILNKLEVLDWSSSCGEIEYIQIADDENNRKILQSLGAEQADFEEMKAESDDDYLEISMFAFKFADYFSQKDGFEINDSNTQY